MTNAAPDSDNAAALQRAYYDRTAAEYDTAHLYEGCQHDVALGYMTPLFEALDIRTVLDVGTGTGRTLRALQANPKLDVIGVEPVRALLDKAVDAGAPPTALVQGSGFHLPFPDNSFDAVVEVAVLHHVPDPSPIVAEMLRVARRAVFVDDDNRFGRGRLSSRLVKLAIYRAGLWPAFWKAKTRGKGYQYTDDDGISYSYSVYDSLPALAEWADRVVLVPTGIENGTSWLHPLLSNPHVLLCAVKGEPRLPWLRLGTLA